MLLERKKRKTLGAAPADGAKQEQGPKSLFDIETEIFALAVVGGDGNRATAYDRLRALTPQERRHLRQSIERLDGLLDQVWLDLHLERNKSRRKGGRTNGSR